MNLQVNLYNWGIHVIQNIVWYKLNEYKSSDFIASKYSSDSECQIKLSKR